MSDITEEHIDVITTKLSDLLSRMCVETELEVKIVAEEDHEVLMINIESEDANLLIGQNGSHLQSLQHLLRMSLKDTVPQDFHLVLDVNYYKRARERHLQRMAWESADKVRRLGTKVTLKPMSAYERRVIHLALSQEPGVITESIGEDPERCVVVKPTDAHERTLEEKISTEAI